MGTQGRKNSPNLIFCWLNETDILMIFYSKRNLCKRPDQEQNCSWWWEWIMSQYEILMSFRTCQVKHAEHDTFYFLKVTFENHKKYHENLFSSSLSCLLSYGHLERRYCAWLVSTILLWVFYCSCSHFMSVGRTRHLKSEALETINLNWLWLFRELYFLLMLSTCIYDEQQVKHPLFLHRSSLRLQILVGVILYHLSLLLQTTIIFPSCAAPCCDTLHLLSVRKQGAESDGHSRLP